LRAFFKPAKNLYNMILAAGESALVEGGTEGLQEIVASIASRVAAKPAEQSTEAFLTELWESRSEILGQAVHAAKIGALIGGGAHVVGSGGQAIHPLQEPKWNALDRVAMDPKYTPDEINKLISNKWGSEYGVLKSELEKIRDAKLKRAGAVDYEGITAIAKADFDRINWKNALGALEEAGIIGREDEAEQAELEYREGLGGARTLASQRAEQLGVQKAMPEAEEQIEREAPVVEALEEPVSPIMPPSQPFVEGKATPAEQKLGIAPSQKPFEEPSEPSEMEQVVLEEARVAQDIEDKSKAEKEHPGETKQLKEVKSRLKKLQQQYKKMYQMKKPDLQTFARILGVNEEGTIPELKERITNAFGNKVDEFQAGIQSLNEAIYGPRVEPGAVTEEGGETVEPPAPRVPTEEGPATAPEEAGARVVDTALKERRGRLEEVGVTDKEGKLDTARIERLAETPGGRKATKRVETGTPAKDIKEDDLINGVTMGDFLDMVLKDEGVKREFDELVDRHGVTGTESMVNPANIRGKLYAHAKKAYPDVPKAQLDATVEAAMDKYEAEFDRLKRSKGYETLETLTDKQLEDAEKDIDKTIRKATSMTEKGASAFHKTTIKRLKHQRGRIKAEKAIRKGEKVSPETVRKTPKSIARDLAKIYNKMLGGVRVKTTAIRKATGESVTIEEDASIALSEINSKIGISKELIRCLS